LFDPHSQGGWIGSHLRTGTPHENQCGRRIGREIEPFPVILWYPEQLRIRRVPPDLDRVRPAELDMRQAEVVTKAGDSQENLGGSQRQGDRHSDQYEFEENLLHPLSR
jgi:hypothetical protein